MTKRKRNYLRASVDVSHKPLFFEIVAPRRFPRDTFTLRNISRKGFFLSGDCILPVETEFEFKMVLSKESLPVTGVCLVKWARDSSTAKRGGQGIGAELVRIDAECETVFYRYIEDCMMELRAIDLATDEWLSVSSSDTLAHAVNVMKKGDLGAVIVLEGNEKVVGIVTEKDVLDFTNKTQLAEAMVGSWMTSKVITVDATEPAETVYQLFRTHTFRHLPVVSEGRFAGMLSLRDLLPYWEETMTLYSRRVTRDNERAISLIVHDLRSPIATIKSANDLLLENLKNPEIYVQADCPRMVESSCDKMLTLIDEILEISQIKVGETAIHKEQMNVGEIVTSTVASFAMAAQKKSIHLEANVQAGVPDIMADPIRVNQIIDNLVSNALKFSPRGSRVEIDVRVNATDGVAVQVKDNGQGIPKSEISRLYKEFSKLSPRPTAGERSTGLGLAITKKLIDAHGGSIEVESEEGKGTTFTVTLPQAA